MRVLLLFLFLTGCAADFKFSELDEQYVARENKGLPREVAPGTTFERVTLSGETITRVYTLDIPSKTTEEIAQSISRAEYDDAREIRQLCSDNNVKTLMSYGFQFFRKTTILKSDGSRVLSERFSCR